MTLPAGCVARGRGWVFRYGLVGYNIRGSRVAGVPWSKGAEITGRLGDASLPCFRPDQCDGENGLRSEVLSPYVLKN